MYKHFGLKQPLQECVSDAQAPTWMTEGCTVHSICSSGAGTNAIEAKIGKQPVLPKCILYGTKAETVKHLVSYCPKLTQKQYKRRRRIVIIRVHCELRIMDWKVQKWCEHAPAQVMENDEVELYWDLTIQTDMAVTHKRPDIILVEKATQKMDSH